MISYSLTAYLFFSSCLPTFLSYQQHMLIIMNHAHRILFLFSHLLLLSTSQLCGKLHHCLNLWSLCQCTQFCCTLDLLWLVFVHFLWHCLPLCLMVPTPSVLHDFRNFAKARGSKLGYSVVKGTKYFVSL
jgi:hypothetical protein